MSYTKMPFECEKCKAKLVAHVSAGTGFGAGGYSATCPKCGATVGSFPSKVVEVVEADST